EFSSPASDQNLLSPTKILGDNKSWSFFRLSKGSQSYYEKYFGRRPQKFRAAWEIGNFFRILAKIFSLASGRSSRQIFCRTEEICPHPVEENSTGEAPRKFCRMRELCYSLSSR